MFLRRIGLKPEWRSKSTVSISPACPKDTEDTWFNLFSFSKTFLRYGFRTAFQSTQFLPRHAESLDDREVIYLDDPADDIDFVTLHNILYFIYIGRVNLSFSKGEADEGSLPEGYPDEADPFHLFRNANKFLLSELKELCLHDLEHEVTPENVAERICHPDCEHHQELKELYFNYLIANYDKVKETEGWERAFCGDEDVSPSTVRYRARLLFDILKKVTQ